MMGLQTKTVDLTLITHIQGDDAGVLEQLVKQGKISGNLQLTPQKVTVKEGSDISLDVLTATLEELILNTSNDNINWDAVKILLSSASLDTVTAVLTNLILNTSKDNIDWSIIQTLLALTPIDTVSGVLKELILEVSSENVNWNDVNALILSVPEDKRPKIGRAHV